MTFHAPIKILAILMIVAGCLPASGQALDPALRLQLRNESPAAWNRKPITSGVMLPRGTVMTTASLRLNDTSGNAVAAQFLPTAWWPDYSIKWVLIDMQASVASGATQTFFLRTGTPAPVSMGLALSQTATAITVTNGSESFTFNRNEFKMAGREFQAVKDGVTYRAVPFATPEADAFPSPAAGWAVEEAGPLKIVLRSDGAMRGVSNPALEPAPYIRYRARLYFFAGQPGSLIFLTLKNNQSYDWAGESATLPLSDQNFSAIRLGTFSLVSTTSNRFGAGIEKTWMVRLATATSTPETVTVQVDPARPAATRRAEPLLRQDAADVARIGGFGYIIPVLKSTSSTLQAVLDRYEKTQRAKVAAEDAEPLANESPSGTVFDHMAPQLGNERDYGDLAWADGWSRNHYDWIYSMDLHWLRTGESRFVDAATIMARHQADLDVYHTWHDGVWFNFMANWEGAGGGGGSHNNPWTEFGAGRPTHTWNQGLMLHWLLTGDRRCRDAAYELIEGARQYLYLAQGGAIQDREIRNQGWLSEVMMTGWLVDPFMTLDTGEVGSGTATIGEAVLAALSPVLALEQADGGHGYVKPDPDATTFQALQIHYVLEPLIKAYDRLLKGTGDPRAAQFRGLIFRMTDLLRTRYCFGDATSGGYRPLQIAFEEPLTPRITPPTEDNQLPWLLMAANAAAYVYGERRDAPTLRFARQAFRDFMYYRETDSGARIDPATRAPTGYLSLFYQDTESKIHGWSGRYGQYYLKMEMGLGATLEQTAKAAADRAEWGEYE